MKAARAIKSGRCCFLDADIFLRSDPFVLAPRKDVIYAVRDPGVYFDLVPLREDAVRLGFPADLYCNTGLFIWDAGNARHRRAFSLALEIAKEVPISKLVDFGEQSYLNAAWHRLGLEVQFLPATHNFFVSEPILSLQRLKGATLENAVGIHLAGFAGPEGKMRKLRELVREGHLPISERELNALVGTGKDGGGI